MKEEFVHLELSDEEHAVLAELLDRQLRDLKEEIYKTETTDYKEALKARERTLVGLIGKVNRSAPA